MNRLNTHPVPEDLTAAVYQTVGRGSVCWENTEVFHSDQACKAAEDLLEWIRDRANLQDLTTIFKEHWEMADKAGAQGHRSEAGLRAVLEHIFGRAAVEDDPDQLALFDCD